MVTKKNLRWIMMFTFDPDTQKMAQRHSHLVR